MRIKSGIIRLLLLFALFAIAFTACGFEGDVELLGRAPIQIGTDIDTFQQKLNKLDPIVESGNSGDIYTIEANGNESGRIEIFKDFTYTKNVTIRITGNGISIYPVDFNSPIFEVGSGVTLVLDNITLYAHFPWDPITSEQRDASLVKVSSGGTLIMNEGTEIGGNRVDRENITIEHGAGVLLDGGTLIMNDGMIHNNVAEYRGGVFVNGGTFVMNNGMIYDNDANYGGGVFIQRDADENIGTFIMNGGTIYNNEAIIKTYGMTGNGGGAHIDNGVFTLNGGTIRDNKAVNGGGVYVGSGIFNMSGGEISKNVSGRGGGAFVQSSTAIPNSKFTKNGGIIYGYDADEDHRNTAEDDESGHAVYAVGGYGGTTPTWIFCNTTVGRNEALGFSLIGGIWTGTPPSYWQEVE